MTALALATWTFLCVASVLKKSVAIIGDIGGHLDVFERTLAAVGVDAATAHVPDDLTVIQVGDLVHKGPNDAGCVQLADRLLATGRYIQLWGNHDAHYVGGPEVTRRPGVTAVDDSTAAVLHRWFDTKIARLAVAVDSKEIGSVLVTHGGLTVGLWEQLGSTKAPSVVADQLNALLHDPDRAFRPGWLMTGVYDQAAGVTCPRTGAELAGPWLERGAMPFSQIHGHEGVWWWPQERFHDDCPAEVREASHIDHDRRFCEVAIREHRLISVDWVLGTTAPDRTWLPFVLHDAVVC